MIVALEGGDAAGKATQAKLLKERLQREGFTNVAAFDFPRYQELAGGIAGQILRGELIVVPLDEAQRASTSVDNDSFNVSDLKASWSKGKAVVLQAMMTVDRYAQMHLLREYSETYNGILILDRYFLSGVVYGQVDGLDRKWLWEIHDALPGPDLCVFLDVPVEEGFRRRPERRDYYERNKEKQQAVRQIYRKEFMGRDSRYYRIVNGEHPVDTIHTILVGLVLQRLDELKRGD